jgi:hypothetical protein
MNLPPNHIEDLQKNSEESVEANTEENQNLQTESIAENSTDGDLVKKAEFTLIQQTGQSLDKEKTAKAFSLLLTKVNLILSLLVPFIAPLLFVAFLFLLANPSPNENLNELEHQNRELVFSINNSVQEKDVASVFTLPNDSITKIWNVQIDNNWYNCGNWSNWYPENDSSYNVTIHDRAYPILPYNFNLKSLTMLPNVVCHRTFFHFGYLGLARY